MTAIHSSLRWLAITLSVRRELMLAIDDKIERFYRPFEIPRPGKTPRMIDRPVGALRFVQGRIKEQMLASYPFPYTLHGCVRGRSPLTNAKAHGKTPLLVNLDLESFYPSVTCSMVYAVWRDVFHFGQPVAAMLTRLTTYRGHVPQGAPTSGYLANIVLVPVAGEIQRMCASVGCTVTFYVDDISISGLRSRELIEPLIHLLQAHYLTVGRGKTHVMTPRSAQITTGYTINSGRPSVAQQKRDRQRERIHEVRVRKSFGHDFAKLVRSVEGSIAHIERTNAGNANRLKRLLERETRR